MKTMQLSINRRTWFFLAAFLLFTTILVSQSAHAVPAFARQTGMACYACHFQSFPTLNSWGRNFKATGYTIAAQPKIEDERLSLPSTLNMSLITKLRYQLTEEVKGGRGEIQWPDEAAFLVGGRAAENVGYLMELNLASGGAAGTADLDANGNGTLDAGETSATVESDTDPTMLSAKFHFNIADNFAAVIFGTDSLGVGYGFETLNTGLQRSQRPIENRKGMSAPQILGLDGKATGIALVYATSDYFVSYSHWAPTWGNVNANVLGGLAHYVRAAYTPVIGGWDTGFGGALWKGTVKAGADDPASEIHVDAWTVDAQAQSSLGDTMTLGVYASYGVVPKGTASKPNHFNGSTTDDKNAFAATAKLGVGNWRPFVGYAMNDTGSDTYRDTTVGTQYVIAQNINLELFAVSSSKSNADYTMLSMFAGF